MRIIGITRSGDDTTSPASGYLDIPLSMQAKRYFISGRVQGVGFRYFVLREVGRIGNINGFTRNLYDGRVEVFAQAGESELEDLEASLRRGPRSSFIARVDVSDEPVDDRFTDFRIVH